MIVGGGTLLLHEEAAFHSAALAVALTLGYIGFDRIDKKRMGKNGLLGPMYEVIEGLISLKIQNAREFFERHPDFNYGNVGRKFESSIFLIRLYLNKTHAVKSDNVDEEASAAESDNATLPEDELPAATSEDGNVVQRWSLSRPWPFSSYWLICRIIERRRDWMPGFFAGISFVKLYCIYIISTFGVLRDYQIAGSIIFDAVATSWVVQRAWRVTRFEPIISKAFVDWNVWLDNFTKETIRNKVPDK